jgi:hypothetical protein
MDFVQMTLFIKIETGRKKKHQLGPDLSRGLSHAELFGSNFRKTIE